MMFFDRLKTDTIQSPINGTIRLGKSYGKPALITNGTPQSGGEFTTMWQKVSQYIVVACPKATTCLLLGVAGGTAIGTLRQKYPHLVITGIELDPAILDVAKNHFGLIEDKKTKFIVADASSFIRTAKGKQYAIIIVDLYIGDRNPPFVKTAVFLSAVKKLLAPGGIVALNADYQKNNALAFGTFLKTCHKLFPVVEDVFQYPKNHILLLR